jgi:hypothetical protein
MGTKLTLNQKLRLIGFRIGFDDEKTPSKHKFSSLDYDLEDTLIAACFESFDDNRILRVLTVWAKTHGQRVIQEKLFKRLTEWERIKGVQHHVQYFTAICVAEGFSGWKKWLTLTPKNPIFPGDEEALKASIKLKGEDLKLGKLGVLVPNGFLRPRPDDVYSVDELTSDNRQYRNRFLYGTNWRADIITAIEAGLDNPSQIAKAIGCSYEPAYRVFHEYRIWSGQKVVAHF